nr:hypothetical protein [Bacteroidota bacterium]
MLVIFGMIGRAIEAGDKKKILDVGLKKEKVSRRQETVDNDKLDNAWIENPSYG